jgi:hypothetical protein
METIKKLKNKVVLRHPGGIALLFISLAASLFFNACNQDPIFYNISQEVKLREPLIKGIPTNIVFFNGSIYVANLSSLYRYGKPPSGEEKPVWDKPAQPPGGDIWGLAATNGYLYALTGSEPKYGLGLKRLGNQPTDTWESVDSAGYSSLQTIYGDSEMLFVGSRYCEPTPSSKDYYILYADETENKLKGLKTDSENGFGLLSGAAKIGSEHYLATKGSGIFVYDGSTVPLGDAISSSKNREITGLIAWVDGSGNAMLAATERDGNILKFNFTSSEFKTVGNVGNYDTTGALALWRTPPVQGDSTNHDTLPPQLLLMGIQRSLNSTSYINGYREIDLEVSDGSLPDSASSHTPSTSVFTNDAAYTSSLGEIPIYHFFQAPNTLDPDMTLFAATQNEGLWSFRNRSEGWQWNAEE